MRAIKPFSILKVANEGAQTRGTDLTTKINDAIGSFALAKEGVDVSLKDTLSLIQGTVQDKTDVVKDSVDNLKGIFGGFFDEVQTRAETTRANVNIFDRLQTAIPLDQLTNLKFDKIPDTMEDILSKLQGSAVSDLNAVQTFTSDNTNQLRQVIDDKKAYIGGVKDSLQEKLVDIKDNKMDLVDDFRSTIEAVKEELQGKVDISKLEMLSEKLTGIKDNVETHIHEKASKVGDVKEQAAMDITMKLAGYQQMFEELLEGFSRRIEDAKDQKSLRLEEFASTVREVKLSLADKIDPTKFDELTAKVEEIKVMTQQELFEKFTQAKVVQTMKAETLQNYLDEIKDQVMDKVDNFREKVASTHENKMETLTMVQSYLEELRENLRDTVDVSEIETALERVMAVQGDLEAKFKSQIEYIKALKDGKIDRVEGQIEVAKAAITNAVESFNERIESIKAAKVGFYDSLLEEVQNAKYNIMDKLDADILDDVIMKTITLKDQLSSEIEAKMDYIRSLFAPDVSLLLDGDAAMLIKDYSEIVGKLQDQYQFFKDMTVGKLEDVKNQVVEVKVALREKLDVEKLEVLSEKLIELKDEISLGISEKLEMFNLVKSEKIEMVQVQTAAIQKQLEELVEDAQEKLMKMKAAKMGAVDDLRERLATLTSDVAAKVSNVEDYKNDIQESVEELSESIRVKLVDLKELADGKTEMLMELLDESKERIQDTVDSLRDRVEEMRESQMAVVEEIKAEISDILANIRGKFDPSKIEAVSEKLNEIKVGLEADIMEKLIMLDDKQSDTVAFFMDNLERAQEMIQMKTSGIQDKVQDIKSQKQEAVEALRDQISQAKTAVQEKINTEKIEEIVSRVAMKTNTLQEDFAQKATMLSTIKSAKVDGAMSKIGDTKAKLDTLADEFQQKISQAKQDRMEMITQFREQIRDNNEDRPKIDVDETMQKLMDMKKKIEKEGEERVNFFSSMLRSNIGNANDRLDDIRSQISQMSEDLKEKVVDNVEEKKTFLSGLTAKANDGPGMIESFTGDLSEINFQGLFSKSKQHEARRLALLDLVPIDLPIVDQLKAMPIAEQLKSMPIVDQLKNLPIVEQLKQSDILAEFPLWPLYFQEFDAAMPKSGSPFAGVLDNFPFFDNLTEMDVMGMF